MSIYFLLVIGHIIGTVIGVGGATYIEIHLNTALKDKKMEEYEKVYLKQDFLMTRIGLFLTIVTGIGFVVLFFLNGGSIAEAFTGNLTAKLTIIAILLTNAVLLSKHKVGLYWGSAFSFVSWWAALIIGLCTSNGIQVGSSPVVGYFTILFVYAIAVVLGALVLDKIRKHIQASYKG